MEAIVWTLGFALASKLFGKKKQQEGNTENVVQQSHPRDQFIDRDEYLNQ